jgi:D-alanyl-D-alanine carboxypeptidase
MINIRVFLITILIWCSATISFAAPYAAIVIDADTGKVLHSENANTRLHPAGLTKLATLYAAFEAVETREVDLDAKVRVSLKAASEELAALGMREGQRVSIWDLIRATAIKGANILRRNSARNNRKRNDEDVVAVLSDKRAQASVLDLRPFYMRLLRNANR